MDEGRKKAQFAAIPLRANSDGRLTDRHYRILGVVAGHDRMSSVRGTGQGAWASHRTMAAEVGGEGADYARFSVSMNKLVRLGYLDREPLAGDARKYTYRIMYTEDDRLQPRKQSAGSEVCPSANRCTADNLPSGREPGEIVCGRGQLSNQKDCENDPQYVSLSEETDSVEAGEINSPEGARLAARDVVRLDRSLSNDANLSRLDRAISQGKRIADAEWHTFLRSLDPADAPASARIHRLIEHLWTVLPSEELGEPPGSSRAAGEKVSHG